jgi:hypothetical protein
LKVIDAKRTGKEIGCQSDLAAGSLAVQFGFESSKQGKRTGRRRRTSNGTN